VVNGDVPERVLMLVLAAYAAVGAYLALVLARRRLLT
jgi:hypothetical protein